MPSQTALLNKSSNTNYVCCYRPNLTFQTLSLIKLEETNREKSYVGTERVLLPLQGNNLDGHIKVQ